MSAINNMSLAETIAYRNQLRRDIAGMIIHPMMWWRANRTLVALENRIMAMANRTRIDILAVESASDTDQDLPEPSPSTLPARSMWASSGGYPDDAEMYITPTGKRIQCYND